MHGCIFPLTQVLSVLESQTLCSLYMHMSRPAISVPKGHRRGPSGGEDQGEYLLRKKEAHFFPEFCLNTPVSH